MDNVEDNHFKEYLKNKEKQTKEFVNENKNIIENFITNKTKLSDSALVSLVILKETNELNKEYKKELIKFNLITEGSKITEDGNTLINEESTIIKLKELIEG